MGESESNFANALATCSAPDTLNAMKPTEMLPSKQLATLNELQIVCKDMKTVFSKPVPRFPRVTSFDIVNYEVYEKLIPLFVHYECIPDELINDENAIESYIHRSTDYLDSTAKCNSLFYTATDTAHAHAFIFKSNTVVNIECLN